MAKQIIDALNDLVTQHKDQPHFESKFKTSVKTIITKDGSNSTQKRKRRAVRLLYSIRSRVNEAVFIYCVSNVGYTVLADVNNHDDTIGKLLSWWAGVKDMVTLSQYANEVFHNNLESVNELLKQGATSQSQQKERQATSHDNIPTPSNLIEGIDGSESNPPVVISQMQQNEQVISSNTAPASSELIRGLNDSNSNTPVVTSQIQLREQQVISRDNAPLPWESFEERHNIIVPWSQLLTILGQLGNDGATAQCVHVNYVLCGFDIMLGSENVGAVRMSQLLSNYTTNALLRPTKTSY